MAGRGTARLGGARLGKDLESPFGLVRPGLARRGLAGQGRDFETACGGAWHGWAWRGKAWQGKDLESAFGGAGRGAARSGKAGHGRDFMTGHTSVRKGKAVIVFMRDGRQIRGQFSEQRGRFIVLADGTKIAKSELRCVTIDKRVNSM